MSKIKVTIELPDEIAEKARELGLLESDQVAALIETELVRRKTEAAERLRETMNRVSGKFRAEHRDLSEDEALAMIEAWISEGADSPNGVHDG